MFAPPFLGEPARWWRVHRIDWLAGGLHGVVLLGAAQSSSATVWRVAFVAMAAISFFAWIGNFSRYRQVTDLPTSKVASAAQGVVALSGRSMLIPDETVTAPLSKLPCCWYRYRIEEKSGNDWTTTDEGVSSSHFYLVDGSGSCFVAPDGAEVLYPQKKSWTDDGTRYTEWLLLPRGPLYAVGEFRSRRGPLLAADRSREVSALLADWKTDRSGLLKRFDADGDGELSLLEYEVARQAACSEVEARHLAEEARGPEHMLCKPEDRGAFILAAAPLHRLGRRFAVWSGLHLAGCIAAVTAAYLVHAAAFTAG